MAGTDGVDQVDTLGVAAALFHQHTSRTVDPQLHTHAVIAAKVQDPTGRWLSLDARFLKRQQSTIGWSLRRRARAELTARLGVTWRPKATNNPAGRLTDLVVVPDELCSVFSERSAQVEAKHAELVERWRAEHDGREPDLATIAHLERVAVTASRPPKTHGTEAAILHDRGQSSRTSRGWTRALTPAAAAPPAPSPEPGDEALIGEALRRVQDESATWIRGDLTRRLSNLVPPDAARPPSRWSSGSTSWPLAPSSVAFAVGSHARRPETRRDGRPVSEAVTDHL